MATVGSARGRRAILDAVRERLVAQIDAGAHLDDCACECPPGTGDGRVLAALVKELRAVLADLDALPGGAGEEADPIDGLAAERADRLADAAGL